MTPSLLPPMSTTTESRPTWTTTAGDDLSLTPEIPLCEARLEECGKRFVAGSSGARLLCCHRRHQFLLVVGLCRARRPQGRSFLGWRRATRARVALAGRSTARAVRRQTPLVAPLPTKKLSTLARRHQPSTTWPARRLNPFSLSLSNSPSSPSAAPANRPSEPARRADAKQPPQCARTQALEIAAFGSFGALRT